MKALQLYDPKMIELGQQMTTEQIARFLDDFRLMHGTAQDNPSKLVSIKVKENLLSAFRLKCESHGLRYQTQI